MVGVKRPHHKRNLVMSDEIAAIDKSSRTQSILPIDKYHLPKNKTLDSPDHHKLSINIGLVLKNLARRPNPPMTTSPSQSTPQPLSAVSLPSGLSPDSIDTVPVLASIISRLQDLSPTPITTSGSPPATSPSQITGSTGPLATKDIHTATDELKHKFQKAREQVKELPDIDRTIGEQEMEIQELEEKIARQREVLERLREVGMESMRQREESGNGMET